MKNESTDATATSRRKFNRSLATTILAFPVISSLTAACKRQEDGKTALPSMALTAARPTKQPCAVVGVGPEPHEPPIGLSDGGSLIINVPASSKITKVVSGAAPRPWKHTFEAAKHTSIDEVRVLTRPQSARPFFMRYLLPANPTYQLRVWLVQLSTTPGVNENFFENPGAEAQLILRPTAPHIEAELQLVPKPFSHKLSAPFRYDYPPLSRPFHIGRWEITDAEGTTVQDIATEELFKGDGDDSYEIFVSFNHS